ncbi:MAG: hypothetical protein U0231_18690 [Nitrospiraceae bacterium]
MGKINARNVAGRFSALGYWPQILLSVLLITLQGCVGLGAWTLGTRTSMEDNQAIQPTRGTVAPRKTTPEPIIVSATDLQTHWGKPDEITTRKDGSEEWIYKIDGLRWSGMVLYVVIIPSPRWSQSVHNTFLFSWITDKSYESQESTGHSKGEPTAGTSA